jgi:flavin-dependent dehydrogenase
MRYEVAIIGGGPAGLAVAIALRQRQIECAIFDGVEPPIDKACGEGLLPGALRALNQLGISVQPSDGYPLSGIDFLNEHCAARALFPGRHAIGVRRVRLHQLMIERANSLSIPLFWGKPATRGNGSSIQHGAEIIHYRWLIIADGQTSPLRKRFGLDAATHIGVRYASRQHFAISPWSTQIEVHWGPRGQIYITPVANDEICVAFLTSTPSLTLNSALADFPALSALSTARPSSRLRGAITTTRMLRRVHTNSAALIGDASGSCDAITGEGLAASFRQALALADAIAAGDLAEYQRAMDRMPTLQHRALAVLSANPGLFEKFLDVHLGNVSFSRFGLCNGATFALRLLLPDLNRPQSSPLR